MQRASVLRGQVSSVQQDANGDPEWIRSVIWVMRISQTAHSEMSRVNFLSRMAMVMVNGTAMHGHSVYNFELENHAVGAVMALFAYIKAPQRSR